MQVNDPALKHNSVKANLRRVKITVSDTLWETFDGWTWSKGNSQDSQESTCCMAFREILQKYITHDGRLATIWQYGFREYIIWQESGEENCCSSDQSTLHMHFQPSGESKYEMKSLMKIYAWVDDQPSILEVYTWWNSNFSFLRN